LFFLTRNLIGGFENCLINSSRGLFELRTYNIFALNGPTIKIDRLIGNRKVCSGLEQNQSNVRIDENCNRETIGIENFVSDGIARQDNSNSLFICLLYHQTIAFILKIMSCQCWCISQLAMIYGPSEAIFQRSSNHLATI